MKNNKKIISLSISLCILLGLLVQLFLPTVALAASEEVVYVKNADQLISLAKKCSYDAWSIGKKVVLLADINLESTEFTPIATFSGEFDGQGHKIKGLNLSGAYSPVGLFSTLGKDAVVKNLTVEGVVSPSGDKGYVGGIVGDNSGKIENCNFVGTVIGSSNIGGIAGINRVSGTISQCKVVGEVIGEKCTGGIAGSNEGLISSCNNAAKINTISVTPTLSLDEINISLTLDITKLPSLNNMTMSDTGGIAGYSTGIVIGCVNEGPVGYPHVGYNSGGIVGRSSGHLNGNTNNALINGRKDVGGIVGQMEPHVSYDLSEDLLASLKAELNRLEAAVNSAVGSADSGIPTVSSRLDSILENLDGATDALDKIIADGSDYGNEVIGEVNRVSEIVSQVISQLSGITDQLPELSKLLGGSLGELESALQNIEKFSSISSGTLNDIVDASNDASEAFSNISTSIKVINIGLGMLEDSLTVSNKRAAEEAIGMIADELGSFIRATDDFTASINKIAQVLDNTPWAEKAVGEIREIVRIFGNTSKAISKIYDATLEIEESIDVYWNKFEEAGDEFVIAIGHFADMTESLSAAIDLIDSGVGKICEGLDLLYNSVIVADAEEMEKAIEKIGVGINEIIDASAKAGVALSNLSELIKNLENNPELAEILSVVSGSISDLAMSGVEMTEAIATLGSGLATALDNISIDFDSISEGGALLIGGVGDIADSSGKIKNAAAQMSNGMTAFKNAVTAINEAVNVKDEEKLSTALDNAYAALGDIIDSTVELASIFESMTNTLDEAMVWGDQLTDAVSQLTKAMTEMTGALVNIQGGIDSLRNNISFDPSYVEDGIKVIRKGLWYMADAAANIKDCFTHISDALIKIDSGSSQLNGAITDIKECIGGMEKAMNSLTLIAEKVNLLVGYLDGVDAVQLPTIPADITATANQMFIYISAIENELKYLNSDISGLGSQLVKQIGKINDIFGNISENIVSIIYSLNDGSFIDNDVSEEEIDSITYGKLFSCTNNGKVCGDINIGGISGVMGLEYSLDPEDDLSGELSVTQKKQYRLKAVIHACYNNGDVISKYDCAGGIVGKMDLGLVYGCEAYCGVESQSGSYVGGIAGITAGLISTSFAKCTLYGGKYVGGIVGSGVTESYSGDSSMVRNCYSMVNIRRYAQYAGAISGINNGEFSENLFVSDLLQGIDRVSYLGKAEPISYKDLIKRRSIPDEFHRFTLEFVADGKILHSTKFEYGSSFDSSIFPEIPKKDGYYGSWDIITLENLVFDTTVSVVYKPYITAIGSSESRDDGREIFFVQGEFIDGDRISINKGCDTSGLTLIEKTFTKDTLVESWILTIPSDNLEVNNIHFLPDRDGCKVFIKMGGEWYDASATEFGSYLTFDASGEEIEIAIVEHSVKLMPIMLLCAGVLVVLALIIVICIVVRRRKKKASKADKEEK